MLQNRVVMDHFLKVLVDVLRYFFVHILHSGLRHMFDDLAHFYLWNLDDTLLIDDMGHRDHLLYVFDHLLWNLLVNILDLILWNLLDYLTNLYLRHDHWILFSLHLWDLYNALNYLCLDLWDLLRHLLHLLDRHLLHKLLYLRDWHLHKLLLGGHHRDWNCACLGLHNLFGHLLLHSPRRFFGHLPNELNALHLRYFEDCLLNQNLRYFLDPLNGLVHRHIHRLRNFLVGDVWDLSDDLGLSDLWHF
mmetsp:Transcript_123946/g.214862  ORF Transcript_123946/g.214862 Transcript_123946/m.214862 type:complete len:247 (+) Transcript_123946:594-1334(+)